MILSTSGVLIKSRSTDFGQPWAFGVALFLHTAQPPVKELIFWCFTTNFWISSPACLCIIDILVTCWRATSSLSVAAVESHMDLLEGNKSARVRSGAGANEGIFAIAGWSHLYLYLCVCAVTNGVEWRTIHVWLILHGLCDCLYCFLPSVSSLYVHTNSLWHLLPVLCVSVYWQPMQLIQASKWKAPLWDYILPVFTFLPIFSSSALSLPAFPFLSSSLLISKRHICIKHSSHCNFAS